MLRASLIGNLGNDPELRYLAQGTATLTFNVASNYRTRTQAGEWQDRTEWVRVRVLGKRAETLGEYLAKGARVYVDGRLEARPWTTCEGEIRAGLELLADVGEFMSSHQDDQQSGVVQPGRPMPERMAVGAGTGQPSSRSAPVDDPKMDLPF